MNFVTSLSSNKRREVVYNSIFVIVDCYIKITKYILVIIKIDVAKLIRVFFEEIVLRFEISTSITSNKEFIFINII